MLGNLVITPQSAHLTHNTEHFSKMDPYVRVHINNQTQDSIVAKRFHKEPFWRGELTFTCSKDQVINFEIWDKCKGKDRLVGSCSLTLAGLTDNYFFDWLPLYFKSKPAGQFLVCIHFYPEASMPQSDNMMSYQPILMNQPSRTMETMTSGRSGMRSTVFIGPEIRGSRRSISPSRRMSNEGMSTMYSQKPTMNSMNSLGSAGMNYNMRLTPELSPQQNSNPNSGMGSLQNLSTDMKSRMPMEQPRPMRPMNQEGGNLGSDMWTGKGRSNQMNQMGMNPMMGSNMGNQFMNPMNKMSSFDMDPLMNKRFGTSGKDDDRDMDRIISNYEQRGGFGNMSKTSMTGQNSMNVSGQMLSGVGMGGPMMTGPMMGSEIRPEEMASHSMQGQRRPYSYV